MMNKNSVKGYAILGILFYWDKAIMLMVGTKMA